MMIDKRTTMRAAMATLCLCVAGASTSLWAQTGVDTSIRPGDDFYAYANGDWLRGTEIPAGRTRWGVRNEIDALTQKQINELMAGITHQPGSPLERQLANYYRAYLDAAGIEAKGLAPIRPELARIAGLHSKKALAAYLGANLRADADPLNWGIFSSPNLFGLAVEQDVHGKNTYVPYLVQGGLGLPRHDLYLSEEPQARNVRSRYQVHMARLLGLAGLQQSEQRAQAVMALETAMAGSHLGDQASDDTKFADNSWPLAEFAHKAPGLDWAAYWKAAGLAQQPSMVVWNPAAVQAESALFASTPLQVWQDYLRVHLIARYADVLPKDFAEEAAAMRAVVAATALATDSRAALAIKATQDALPEAVGRLYAAHYFTPAMKAQVQTIAADVIAAFGQRIQALPWLTPETKAQAMVKLKGIYFGVGYPEHWKDYSQLRLDAHDALGNAQRVAQWNYRTALAKLGKPVDMTEWWMAPQRVGAVSVPLQNSYNFAAALLQGTKFDVHASAATNYGAIGAIIGHEVSHFFDDLGGENDAQGLPRKWRSDVDVAQFHAAAQPLAEQYAAYHPAPDLSIDGKLTLSENVADLGGLAAAFDAYRRTLGDKAQDAAFVRAQDRAFFIGFARSWRAKVTDAELRKQLATDSHAPEGFRIATVRNMDAWYEAFDVQPTDRLYLEPRLRVRIW